MNAVFPDWLNANSGRAYPLSENGSRLDSTSTIKIPDSLIVAAQINMLPSYIGGTFFIRFISVSSFAIIITIGYSILGADRDVAKITVSPGAHKENDTYAFVGSGQDSSILGSLTIGRLDDALSTVPGGVEFSSESSSFEVSALFVSSPAIEAVEVYSGNSLVKRFSSVLKLRAGENIRLTYVDPDQNIIRIDAISGENLTEPSGCENATPLPPCIRTINGQVADENGNFNIDGGKCIDVTASKGNIKLEDLCSKSCCGCTELEELVAGLKGVEGQISQLKFQMDATVVRQNLMITNLVSNLG